MSIKELFSGQRLAGVIKSGTGAKAVKKSLCRPVRLRVAQILIYEYL
jgi:hypothetical protein